MRFQRGLTLIELLVAVALTALIALLSWQGLDQALSLQNRLTDQRQRLLALQRLHWFLQRDLLQMAPRPIRDETGETLGAFVLTPERAEWTRVALMPGPLGEIGLLRVGYRLHDDKVERLVWPTLDRAPDAAPRVVPLLENVASWKVEAFVIDPETDWQTEWPWRMRRPMQIRITLRMKEDDTPLLWRFRILEGIAQPSLTGAPRRMPDIYERSDTL